MRTVVRAVLRSPYGKTCERYIDPVRHPVRPGVKVSFTGARDLWTVITLDTPEKLPTGYDYWTVTGVVE